MPCEKPTVRVRKRFPNAVAQLEQFVLKEQEAAGNPQAVQQIKAWNGWTYKHLNTLAKDYPELPDVLPGQRFRTLYWDANGVRLGVNWSNAGRGTWSYSPLGLRLKLDSVRSCPDGRPYPAEAWIRARIHEVLLSLSGVPRPSPTLEERFPGIAANVAERVEMNLIGARDVLWLERLLWEFATRFPGLPEPEFMRPPWPDHRFLGNCYVWRRGVAALALVPYQGSCGFEILLSSPTEYDPCIYTVERVALDAYLGTELRGLDRVLPLLEYFA